MWGVSLTHPMLTLLSCGEFLLHIPCCLQFYLGSFSYTSCAGFVYIWGVCRTHPDLSSFDLGIFSYTSHADFVLMWGVCLTHPVLLFFFVFVLICGVSLAHPVLCWFLCKEILLYFPCCLLLLFIWKVSLTPPVLVSFPYRGSFPYTSRAGFILSGEFLLHVPCWLHFYRGSFSYVYRTSFTFIWGVSLTHPIITLCLCGEFLLHIPCWLVLFICVFSLTHPVLVSFFIGGLHIPLLTHLIWLDLYRGSFCYTSRAGFIFTQPMLASFVVVVVCLFLFLWREFVWHVPCCLHFYVLSCLHFYVESFSYTSHAGFFLCGEFLLHIPIWLLFLCLTHTEKESHEN